MAINNVNNVSVLNGQMFLEVKFRVLLLLLVLVLVLLVAYGDADDAITFFTAWLSTIEKECRKRNFKAL